MASAVLFDRQRFDRIVLCRTVAKVLSMGFVVRKCFQCSAGKRHQGGTASSNPACSSGESEANSVHDGGTSRECGPRHPKLRTALLLV
jgi:hypothetical protein